MRRPPRPTPQPTPPMAASSSTASMNSRFLPQMMTANLLSTPRGAALLASTNRRSLIGGAAGA